jgi:hypothetical protein
VALAIEGATHLRPDALIMDYFAGSGTTAHAVINLNREDGGRRKYILVEMGEYFDTVLVPRIKKVAYSKDWKDWYVLYIPREEMEFRSFQQVLRWQEIAVALFKRMLYSRQRRKQAAAGASGASGRRRSTGRLLGPAPRGRAAGDLHKVALARGTRRRCRRKLCSLASIVIAHLHGEESPSDPDSVPEADATEPRQ